jgi:hypothetical protein
VFESSNLLLKEWKSLFVVSFERKYLKMKLRSLKPMHFSISMGAYHILHFVQGTDIDYFKTLLDQSITALLLVSVK